MYVYVFVAGVARSMGLFFFSDYELCSRSELALGFATNGCENRQDVFARLELV